MNAITPIRPDDWTHQRVTTTVNRTIRGESGLWIDINAEAGRNTFSLSVMEGHTSTRLRIPVADVERIMAALKEMAS